VIVLGPKEYTIHKVIVATGERASAFLAASFRKHCGQTSERTDLTELIPQTCWPHFEALLDYVYHGEDVADIEVRVSNWGPLMKIADILQIRALYTKCVEVGADLISHNTAPNVVADAVELQLGGELQQQVVQIAVDVMSQHFSSYTHNDLLGLPLQVFEALLQRDDLEVTNEDQVFDFLVSTSKDLGDPEMQRLWRCCRLHALSPERTLQIMQIDAIPKAAVVWALSQRVPTIAKPAPNPDWAKDWVSATGPRGREITFLVPNPAAYANKRHLRSAAHQLCEKFKWRLLVFPLGTESTGNPRQVAAFVEVVPEPSVEAGWSLRRVKYTITLVNWADERKNITKEHIFDFSASEVDNGWHRGWVTPEALTASQGWLNESSEVCFRARCDVKNASIPSGD